ncbi:acyltransferase family protein [Spongiivirga sp. MCCC 1A20706]|uniref:acyltransferase family protein n=1 Tax=Spongiivirga sp. MCCC 1A20706 TaxID=3160963 RepID=UPI003977D5BA
MNTKSNRIYFIDAIRAFAILMMLQGHFISSLLADSFKNHDSFAYNFWEYFRGVTAPMFFTITGFVFVFLLMKKGRGYQNPRVLKGIKRAFKLILWGYMLHLSLSSLFGGSFGDYFFLINVLQIIGLSILLIIGLYLLFSKVSEKIFQYALLILTVIIFLWERAYAAYSFSFLPDYLANWFTKANGSVFTIFPWFGYVAAGGFMALIFKNNVSKSGFYKWFIYTLLITGSLLLFTSSWLLSLMYDLTGINIFFASANYNYLFTRMGDVLIIFALFAMVRKYFEKKLVVDIGSRTLSIYIVHFIILYGSLTGIGLSRFFYNSLNPLFAVLGALTFIVVVCTVVLQYYKIEPAFFKALGLLKQKMIQALLYLKTQLILRYRLIRQRSR